VNDADRVLVIGDHDDQTVAQLRRCVEAVPGGRGVLCADGHLGYSQPIGGAVAYREHVSPSGVGFDIGCGNKAVRTTLRAGDLRPDLRPVMDAIVERIEFGVGGTNRQPVGHPVLDEIRDAPFAPQRKLHRLAAEQLGTVGSGNHYVNLMEDERGDVWVGVHFGSRGFGHRTASGFLALAQGLGFQDHAPQAGMDAPPTLLHEKDALGEAYVAAMELALRYAYAGRDVVVDEVLDILGAEAVEGVHNNHNDMRRETHDGEDCWVVRKGCTPAFAGQRGFVGASMAEPSVILEGVESPQSAASLYSTVHGAGRALSRTAAAGRLRKRRVGNRTLRVREGGVIDFAAVQRDVAAQGIELRGGAADEAPDAYKRLDAVLRYHEGTIRILHTLTPMGVAMAGAGTFDPYRD
jgi:tRNA-splicing ligase RtcB